MSESDLYKELGKLTKDRDRWKENVPYVSSLLSYVIEYEAKVHHTDLLKEMLDENKTAQLEAEKEIAFFQDEVSKEEKQIAWMNTQYKEIRDWAAQFDAASLDTKKMILARLIEKITVDRDYNIEIFYYVTVEDFNGEACITVS